MDETVCVMIAATRKKTSFGWTAVLVFFGK
jgi:hypothetical protein